MPLVIKPAYKDIDKVKQLFKEYTDFLGIDLRFQNYDEEFLNLPGEYDLPRGRLYIAEYDGQLAGCIAMHPYGDSACEMKRLYVRPEFRGKGIASALIRKIVSDAEDLQY
ncbi:MAG: N-acetyltransferase, partial [Clostridia bacterium]|nr:N-acetyltransferase [Clostridia bacterium]